ncbi:MAG: metal-dependent transcriptional regulator [Chthonomonadales bacterium]
MPSRNIYLRVPATCRPVTIREAAATRITEPVEEYVEGIWRLQKQVATVGTGEIAQYMNVAPASVTPMLKRMATLGLVEHRPYQGVRCTDKGEALAVELLRRHRLIECLLVDFLKLPWHGVHDLACKLEHYIGPDVADHIARALGSPSRCPHGNPILDTTPDGSIPLGDLPVPAAAEVVKITDEREEFLRYLTTLSLVPGTRVELVGRTPFGDVLTLRIEGREEPVAVGGEVSASVYVQSIGDGSCNEGSTPVRKAHAKDTVL